jgi:murein L,D-transpeptidase YafK
VRSLIRPAQRLSIVCFVLAASAVADGSNGVVPGLPAFGNDVERSLVRAIMDLREGGLRKALADIDALTERSPNFRLAHLIRGDLLMASAGQPVAFAGPSASATVAPLQDEARKRLQRYLDAPPVGYMPAALLQLGPHQGHALLVDTSRSRLYVYANDFGRPRYVTDFYISLGKNGVEKSREGDQKTPLGVYTIIGIKDKLPDFYGTNAYPLSYPNEWDKLHGRNGHGIWLHGTPSDTYSRAPLATDGCVVLSNEDLARVAKFVDVTRTPVVIVESVEWRDPNRWEADREAFLKAFGRWKSDWESMDTARYLAHYSHNFRSENSDYATWTAKKRNVNAGKSWIKIGVNDVSLFAYPGAGRTVMISFEQDYRSNNMSRKTHKRQYWSDENGQWRIVHEAVVS